MSNRVVDIIFGGDAGSEGKGKLSGFLALTHNYEHAITNYFPNAGHTWKSDAGEKVMTRYLPTSLVNKETRLYLGPGSAIKLDILLDEIESYEKDYEIKHRLHIHPRAVIVTDNHIEMEKAAGLERISSTLQGGSGALAEKAMRKEGLQLAGDVPELEKYIALTNELLLEALAKSESILIEGAQGFELDINYGFEYPNTTSRQTTPAQLLADCGIPLGAINRIYCVIRTYPIRVGGPSGKMAGEEIYFDIIEERSGADRDTDYAANEFTTVTKKQRRVFEQSIERLKLMVQTTQPDFLFVNFIQYIHDADKKKTEYEELSQKVKDYLENLQTELAIPIKYIGTEAENKYMIVRN